MTATGRVLTISGGTSSSGKAQRTTAPTFGGWSKAMGTRWPKATKGAKFHGAHGESQTRNCLPAMGEDLYLPVSSIGHIEVLGEQLAFHVGRAFQGARPTSSLACAHGKPGHSRLGVCEGALSPHGWAMWRKRRRCLSRMRWRRLRSACGG